MEIALALSGQPRFFRQTHKYFFSNLIDNLNCDVYLHTWHSDSMVNGLYPCAAHAKNSLDDEDLLVWDYIPSSLLDLYKPIAYQFDDYNVLAEHKRKSNYYQFYTQWAVGQLIRKRYDVVIRSRFDLMCTQEIEVNIDNNVWVASCCPYTDRHNDMLSISNHDNFLRLSETYLNLEHFESIGKGEMEWAQEAQINKEKLSVKCFEASYESFDIMRSKDKIKFPL